ncbi:MAG: phosphatidylglycerol lysyltransferase domain-containing protein [Clostridia bacterium]|nr:phosphatidylglycerol lysyltransferase domain-containing protein [Clostridia bacterium]
MGIEMINFSEITIEDKALFDKYLRPHNPQVSEMTFTNFFMWRNFYKFRYAEINGLLCVIAVPEGKNPFCFVPFGKPEKAVFTEVFLKLKTYFQINGWKLRFERMDEIQSGYFREYLGFTDEYIVKDTDNSDYVYFAENLINLRGKKFDGKRNHINKFKKMYNYEYVMLSSENTGECSKIMDKWCLERSCEEHKDFYCEKKANMELLNNFTALSCKGALIKVNGEFEAFTVGEMLNEDTAVIHIEKANGSINGLYTFINQQFCEREWREAAFINREQDLGIEGLRKAKLSYHPAKMINKYKLIL